MAQLISIQSLTKSYGSRVLFDGISFGLEEGTRLGLIGPNGSGKSTLLTMLAGTDSPDSGEISRRRGLVVGYVPQRDTFEAAATVSSVLHAALGRRALDEHEREVFVGAEIGRHGFPDADQPAATLSGGWQKRLSIIAQMILEPDVLLLDEPTNHLDLEGILWLEEALKSSAMALVTVSHDRYFLERVCTRLVELSRSYAGGFFDVRGSYSEFLDARQEYLVSQGKQEAALAGQVRREIEWLRRGPPARTTKAKFRIDDAGRMIRELADLKERNSEDRGAKADFTASGRKTRDLLVAHNISKSMNLRSLFRELDVALSPGTRLGLLGPNGSGKSTLLSVLAGRLESDSGTIKTPEKLNIVWFEQDRSILDPDQLLRHALAGDTETVNFRGSTMHVSAWARQFLFRPEQLDAPVRAMSGGEQARLLIAGLMLQPADLLILDEPTNDLDISTLEILENSLLEFQGALILVTHDRFMLERVATEILALDGNGGARYYADYSQWQKDTTRVTLSSSPSPRADKPAPGAPRTFRGLTRPEQRELDRMEEKISSAESLLAMLQEEMASQEVVTDYIKLQEYMARVDEQTKAVSVLYDRWAELEDKRSG